MNLLRYGCYITFYIVSLFLGSNCNSLLNKSITKFELVVPNCVSYGTS